MAFLFGKLAFVLLRPSNLLLLLALAGLLGGRCAASLGPAAVGRRRAGHRRLHPPAGRALADHAAGGPLPGAPADAPAAVDGIVVLGGGVDGGLTRARGQPSFRDSMERFAAIPELARRYPERRGPVHRRPVLGRRRATPRARRR